VRQRSLRGVLLGPALAAALVLVLCAAGLRHVSHALELERQAEQRGAELAHALETAAISESDQRGLWRQLASLAVVEGVQGLALVAVDGGEVKLGSRSAWRGSSASEVPALWGSGELGALLGSGGPVFYRDRLSDEFVTLMPVQPRGPLASTLGPVAVLVRTDAVRADGVLWRGTARFLLFCLAFMGTLAAVLSGVVQRQLLIPLRALSLSLSENRSTAPRAEAPVEFAAREITGFACELNDLLDAEGKELRELRRNAAELRLLGQLTRIADRADDFETALRSSCSQIARFLLWPIAHVYLMDDDDPRLLVPSNVWHMSNPNIAGSFVELTRMRDFRIGEGLPGIVVERREPVWLRDAWEDPLCTRTAPGLNPVRSGVAFPIFQGQEVIGVLELFDLEPREREIRPIALMHHLGLTLGQVLGRRRTQELLVRRNRELAQALRQVESSTRAKDAFLANMTHEIRTPMTAILGSVDLLAADAGDCDRQSSVETIRKNGRHLLRLIGNILDFSKIEAGRLELEIVDSDLAELFHQVRDTLQGQARERELSLEIVYEGAVPERIHTDPMRLCQILLNLAGNALKFTERGGVRVLVSHSSDPGGAGNRLWICVEDSGMGLREQQLKDLFMPFSQADSSMSRRFGGVGLGLSISKSLVELLGGSISVEERSEGGTRFRFNIEAGFQEGVAFHESLPPPSDPVLAPSPEEAETEILALADAYILLAEDGPDNQKLLSRFCVLAGAKVEVAENGALALDRALAARAAGQPFDLILMDMQMPVMDGYEATQRLRREGIRQPIVAITAHAMPGERERCIAAGCDEFLAKPIPRSSLINTLARILS